MSLFRFNIRPSVAYVRSYHTREAANVHRRDLIGFRMSVSATISNRFMGTSGIQGAVSLVGIKPLINPRSQGTNSIGTGVTNGGDDDDPWVDIIRKVWQCTYEKAKPHMQLLLAGGTLATALLVWFLMPWLSRLFVKYSMGRRDMSLAPVPSDSFWGVFGFFVFLVTSLRIGEICAPNIDARQNCAKAWKGVAVFTVVFVLLEWKRLYFDAKRGEEDNQRDNLVTVNKCLSVGLFLVGSMALATTMQSILSVGGIGVFATAFATKDILGNVLSGLTLLILNPFSVGDKIKAGSIKGVVVDIGLATTSLLTAEGFPVVVPNSLFTKQNIVNQSGAKWHPIVKKIAIETEDMKLISEISEDIKKMLRSNENVFLEEAPNCFLSQIAQSYAELTFSCNLKKMEMYTDAEHEIVSKAVEIVIERGTKLASK